MLPLERATKKQNLGRVFEVIKRECVDVMHSRRECFWSYERLAGFSDTEPADWASEGWARNMIQGHEARQWLLSTYQLFHRPDMENHEGIIWTCNPLVGMAWESDRKRDRTISACDHMQAMSSLCATIAPSQGLYFTKMGERWGTLGQRTRKTITPGHMRLAQPAKEGA